VSLAHDDILAGPHHALCVRCRKRKGCEANPTAAIIESESVKSAERRRWIDQSGFHSGKKIKGKKRHVLVHT
jgi:hypothetical protein